MVNGKWKCNPKSEATAIRARSASSSIFHATKESPWRTRRGFSFAEVMFAVVILGIGFIMVAAIFPVAIQQSQSSSEESTAAAIANEASAIASQLGQIPSPANPLGNPVIPYAPSTAFPVPQPSTLSLFPPTIKNFTGLTSPPAIVVPFGGARWDGIRNNIILPSDTRYAYVPFYRRESGSNVAQLIVLAVQVRNRTNYDNSLDLGYGVSQATTATFTRGTGAPICPDQVKLVGGSPQPGLFVSVLNSYSGDTVNNPPLWQPFNDRRVYRLGRRLSASGDFELEPGDDMRRGPGTNGRWDSSAAADPTTPLTTPAPAASTAGILPPATLQPVPVWVDTVIAANSVAGQIDVFDMDTVKPSVYAASGAFVIIADDYPYDPTTYNPASPTVGGINYAPPAAGKMGLLNGRIFRLGAAVPGYAGRFELVPGYGLNGPADAIPITPTGTPGPYAKAYIVGLGKTDPTTALGAPITVSGNTQDISVYSTIFPVP